MASVRTLHWTRRVVFWGGLLASAMTAGGIGEATRSSMGKTANSFLIVGLWIVGYFVWATLIGFVLALIVPSVREYNRAGRAQLAAGRDLRLGVDFPPPSTDLERGDADIAFLASLFPTSYSGPGWVEWIKGLPAAEGEDFFFGSPAVPSKWFWRMQPDIVQSYFVSVDGFPQIPGFDNGVDGSIVRLTMTSGGGGYDLYVRTKDPAKWVARCSEAGVPAADR